MSDEMKPTSEDTKIMAGNAPRHDSAEAAALTVGSPSSSSSFQTARSGSASKHASLSLATRAGITALAVVSVLFIGASAFALTNGFGLPGDSPIVKAAESVGIVRSADVEAASAEGSDQAKADKDEASNEANAADKESEDKKDASSDASGSDESKSKGDGSSSDNSDSSGSSDSGSGPSSSSNADSGSSSSSSGASSSSSGSSGSSSSAGGSSQPGTSAPAGTVTVYVSVSSSAVGNPVSGGGTFTFNQGATVYDALCACGLSMNASNTGYGIYVSAIGGLAEKEHGGHSGWMYSVNGAVPMTACSNYVLLNGDSVSWYYVTG
ncbi:MAG: DUF4430 domain-containing protein [Slackia sp.]|uniref:Transcobalamin-like C-terminal domain-containing protein n=1 Tax=Slackia isoflavoniconvertens TaxID=572010 RepID=A0A3N0ILN7_9ACTN|nr:DUF4430 domain-containing protein [Slackia isoflavoniconvertens]MBB3278526.1 hypothetical protein [Slackia isoflavoniconvertens]MDR4060097.1 DUF4430 domain-containing protein [Slackia sp.]RNM37516.1 hypothetical protein DMP05_00960 [Slackia isoflavoniconvertens]